MFDAISKYGYFYVCASLENFEKVVSTKSGSHTVRHCYMAHPHPVQYDWTCTCLKFKIRKTCKHIEQVKKSEEFCGWHQFFIPKEPDQDEEGTACCPDCGGTVNLRRWHIQLWASD